MGDAGVLYQLQGMAAVPWELLLLIPMGIIAGLLAGLLGIGGGLVFSPLLLGLGLAPHQALATSTLAILPTTFAGSWTHLRNGSLPLRGAAAIGLGALGGGRVFSHLGGGLRGWPWWAWWPAAPAACSALGAAW